MSNVNLDELDDIIDGLDTVEENEDDICTNDDENCAESDDDCAVKSSGKGRKLGEKYTYRTAMIMLNETMRIYISENERSMHLQRKSKSDVTDNWAADSYFCHIDKLLITVLEICSKERIYTKQIKDFKEVIGLYREIRNDIKIYANMINNSIKNDAYLKELRDM